MSNEPGNKLIYLLIALGMLLLVAAFAVPAYYVGKYRRECMEYGYPDIVYFVGHEPYCRNVIEAVPLETLKVKP